MRRFWSSPAAIVVSEGGEGGGPTLFPPTEYIASGDAGLVVLQGPHVDDGISCWQIEITAEDENSCVLELPASTGVPAAFGQTWKLEAWIRQDAFTADEIDSFALSIEADTGSIGADGTLPTEGGDLSDSYRQFEGVINAGHEAATLVYGKFNMILVGPGSITLTIAFKLSRVS